MSFVRYCLLSLLLSQSLLTLAQTNPPVSLPATETRSIQSTVLTGETYQLLVHFPDNYDAKKRYDILFVLDGVGAFSTAINCLGLLHGDCDTGYNEPLLIGISDGAEIGKPGNKRDRDFTPTAFKTAWGSSGGGGSPTFLTFIEKEVIPFVEKTYPVTQNRAIYGYSYGGLFMSYVLLTKPDLFKTILICSPSLFADNAVIFRQVEPAYAKTHHDLPASVWLSVGANDENLIDDTKKFADVLKNRAYPSLKLHPEIIPNVNHLTGIQPTMFQAFRWAYCGTAAH